MIKVAIVGCTGKLGNAIMKNVMKSADVELCYAIARKGNQYVGRSYKILCKKNKFRYGYPDNGISS